MKRPKKISSFKVEVWHSYEEQTFFYIIKRLRRFGFATFWKQVLSVWKPDEIAPVIELAMLDEDKRWTV